MLLILNIVFFKRERLLISTKKDVPPDFKLCSNFKFQKPHQKVHKNKSKYINWFFSFVVELPANHWTSITSRWCCQMDKFSVSRQSNKCDAITTLSCVRKQTTNFAHRRLRKYLLCSRVVTISSWVSSVNQVTVLHIFFLGPYYCTFQNFNDVQTFILDNFPLISKNNNW